ncbi:Sperm nuclear basic protein PL-I isoform PLIb [Rhodotorula toruloides ATCC 204091]|uniref:Sperm nuclear basic protein PL-I isoform PLIb n=1 Tax=Rhodotorula toruloides TaxID=5286 RepID=A0A2T0AEN3_RHOTO|nr:Sperm nuclear basic protein PL-I isoform PLIb [Rhodotorula toruloides ATCC 204091]KAK4335020.1 Sperm nuclear basic protein PL-I isoform PLIb [Rhodotorula toruloides]PRQ76476.1 sperm nuclear basic protein PL-I isoform PLIb [Rhodotorula toruloides]
MPSDTVNVSFIDLIWMLQPVPVGTKHSLPALGSPKPWYILPAPLAKNPAPWERRPNRESERLLKIHNVAAENMKQLEKQRIENRDPAAVKAEQNRKKKERKLRSKARKEAGESGEAKEAEAEKEATELEAPRPTVAYALPAYISDETQEAFLAEYARIHKDMEDRRLQEAEVTLPSKFKDVPLGHAFLIPREHPKDPQRGVVFDQKSLTMQYYTE